MLTLLSNTWALLLGILLLMVGNGMQGALLGVRGAIEGFSATEMSIVMTGYFMGFLVSSRATPNLIRRVGHVRVFAAMASVISAVFILYAAVPNIWAWAAMRVLVGAAFASVYVVAESWLNDSATNETRGKALSAYMFTQILGIIVAQGLLNVADPAGYDLFVLISVAVSLSFLPILLSVSPAPVHGAQKTMRFRDLYRASPLGFVGTIFLGAVFSAMFGMAAVYGTERGLTVPQISVFIASIYLGGLVLQFPVGWLSDRMDRRHLILAMTLLGGLAAGIGAAAGDALTLVLAMGFMVGGIANPLYSLLIAHTNDFLQPEDMASASGGLLFLNGVGAIGGPVMVGALMQGLGAWAFFGFIAAMFGVISAYAAWRMTRRPSVAVSETASYSPVTLEAGSVVVTTAAGLAAEHAQEAQEPAAQAASDGHGARSERA